jgi:hypothetical protein
MRKSIDFKNLQSTQEKEKVRETTLMKTQKLGERVTSEVANKDRERKKREEIKYLEKAKQRAELEKMLS